MSKIDKNANLYDIDGNIIQNAELHNMSVEEVEKLVDDLAKKAEENPENEVYKVYLSNAQKHLFTLYNTMDRASLMKRISALQNSVEDAKNKADDAEKEQLDAANKAIDELKQSFEGASVDTEMERSMDITTSVTPEEMDEYVQFEEVDSK